MTFFKNYFKGYILMMTFQMIFRIISKYSGDIHVKHKIKKNGNRIMLVCVGCYRWFIIWYRLNFSKYSFFSRWFHYAICLKYYAHLHTSCAGTWFGVKFSPYSFVGVNLITETGACTDSETHVRSSHKLLCES